MPDEGFARPRKGKMMSDSRQRTPFPVQRSILSVEALEEVIRNAYQLKVTGCELLKPQLSDIYRIDSESGPYILRVYPHSMNLARWIAAEVNVLTALQAVDLPVSKPIAQTDGRWLLALDAPEGERYAVLYSYARGRSLKRFKDPELYRAFGRLAASVHAAAENLPPVQDRAPLDRYALLARPMEVISATYPEHWKEVEELREVAEQVARMMDQLPQAHPYWGFCHGELNFSNVHVSPEGELTLFDFEYCGPGWPVYDIATVFNFEPLDAARIFLEGYETLRPLHPRERSAIGWFQIAHKIWMLGMATSLSSVFGSLMTSGVLLDQVLEFVRETEAAL